MSAKRALSPGGITERNLKTDTSPEKGREASHETKKAKRRKIPKTPTRSYPKQTPPPTIYDTGDVGSVKIPEAPLAKYQPSLLGLPVELLLQILVQVCEVVVFDSILFGEHTVDASVEKETSFSMISSTEEIKVCWNNYVLSTIVNHWSSWMLTDL
jgi:hypothetical protein